MTVRAIADNLKVPTDEERFDGIRHPKWCSLEDHELLQARGRGESFASIAKDLQRPTRAIEQRYHQLRVVRGIEDLLLRYGLMDRPYDLDERVIFNELEASE